MGFGDTAGGGSAVDTVVTVVLFVLLSPAAVAVASLLGTHMFMLSDGYPTSRVSIAAIVGAVVSPTLGTLAINTTAVIWACNTTGNTFWLPLAAAATSALWTVAVCGAAGLIVQSFR